MPSPLDLLERARLFATAAHAAVGRLRKCTGEPYVTHAAAVVEILRSVPHDEAMLAAAWLHDVVEDTAVGLDVIEAEFGPEVAELVGAITSTARGSDAPRAVREALDRERLATASARAQTVKLADIIDNAGTVAEHAPEHAVTYIAEKAAMLEVLRAGDPNLWARAAGHLRPAVDGEAD